MIVLSNTPTSNNQVISGEAAKPCRIRWSELELLASAILFALFCLIV